MNNLHPGLVSENSVTWVASIDRVAFEAIQKALPTTVRATDINTLKQIGHTISWHLGPPTVIVLDIDGLSSKADASSGASMTVRNHSFLSSMGPNYALVAMVSKDKADALDKLQLDVDDFIFKPLNQREVRSRIERARANGPRAINYSMKIFSEFADNMTAIEFKILSLFILNHGRLVTREQLLKAIWQMRAVNPKTVDVHLFNLRKKILKAGYRISATGAPGSWELTRVENLVSRVGAARLRKG